MNFDRVKRLIDKFAAETVPGCGAVVMRGDEILFEAYGGCKDLETKTPVDADTIFRQASTTKLFTYVILAQLYEEGKILFTDPISDYLPEWKDTVKWVQREDGSIDYVAINRPINIKDATSMACGLPYCMFIMDNPKNPTEKGMSEVMKGLLAKGTPTIREEVRGMSKVPVMFDPGTHFLYGFGSEIVGAIVEEITGKTVRENFVERLIEPLGLTSACTWKDASNEQNFVHMYAKDSNGIFTDITESADRLLDKNKVPMGARANLNISCRDFAKFIQMLANGGTYKGVRILSPGTVRMLRSNVMNEDQLKDFTNDYLAGYGYGYGFRTLMDQGLGSHNGHLGSFGWTGGFGTWAEADPVTGTALVYMHNMAPNEELYHHIRVRNTIYAALEEE